MSTRSDFADHDLRVRVPRADEDAIPPRYQSSIWLTQFVEAQVDLHLIKPELPFVMKSELVRPDADHSPAIQ